VVSSDADAGNAPQCVCGALMEKHEEIPAFTYLDFLRGDRPEE
jgi:hypothetical protein